MTWLGLLLGSQRGMPASDAYPAVRAEARAAAEGGFAVLVAPEHLHAEPYGMLQPWPLLGAVREAVGGQVATVASIIAGLTTAERISADLATLRAIGGPQDGGQQRPDPVGVALAAGYRPEDFAAAGRGFPGRFERRGAILERLAAEGACDAGMLWSAAGTARAARRAAAGGVPWYGAPTLTDAEAAAIADDAGVAPVLRRDVLLDPGDDRWERYVAPKYGAYAAWGYGDDAGAVIAGTPAEVSERLAATIDNTRPAGLVLRLCWPDMPGEIALEHVQAFAADVAPAVRPVTAAPLATTPSAAGSAP